MTQRRYYDEEMRYLHEAGKAFAEAHPEQARYLNVDSVTDRDPYVERLFEGFALLTGRIRERLDDELPQYTEALCELLYPHFLRPFPSMSLVEFQPKSGAPKVLPRGTEVQSAPVGPEQVICRFGTTSEVQLHPIRLHDVALEWAADGTSSATLSFQPLPGTSLADLDLNRLRLYFHADPAMAAAMHLFFTRRVHSVELGDGTQSTSLHGQQWVEPGGLGVDEALLPASERSFSGVRLLQELLCFQAKFWCVDLLGLDRFQLGPDAAVLQVRVQFDRGFPEAQRFGKEQIRLFTSPVVNLFELDAEPVRVDHRSADYRVVPDARRRSGVEVYAIQTVTGIEDMTGRRHAYRALLSPERGPGRTYTATSRKGLTDRYDTTLTLQGIAPSEDGTLPVETVSLELLCTNGTLPREELRERSITRLASKSIRGIDVVNLTQPTLIRYPPTERQQDFFWKLVSHWSLNYQSAATREALVGVLGLYDWTGSEGNRRRIEGVRDVRWAPKEMIYRGAVLRGSEVTVEVDETRFNEAGDAALLGLVLSRFFAAYATINSFVHLALVLMPSGETLRWEPPRGEQPLL